MTLLTAKTIAKLFKDVGIALKRDSQRPTFIVCMRCGTDLGKIADRKELLRHLKRGCPV